MRKPRKVYEHFRRTLEIPPSVAYNTYNDTYNWQEEIATYSGDRRALNNNDWALVNNTNFYLPRREDILNSLYRNIYSQVKNNISNVADW